MELFAKLLEKAWAPLLLSMIGSILLLAGFVEKLPSTSGGDFVLRAPPNMFAIYFGGALLSLGLIVGMSIFMVQARRERHSRESSRQLEETRKQYADVIKIKDPGGAKVVDTKKPSRDYDRDEGGNDGNDDDKLVKAAMDQLDPKAPDYAVRLGDRFMALTITNKRIIAYLYKYVKSTEIGVDDFAKKFSAYYPDKPLAETEMYLRLVILSMHGFMRIRSVGARTSIAIKTSEAGTVLLTGTLLDS